MKLRRELGLTTVIAIVIGDMFGSGIFFTPGQLAAITDSKWQVYFFWGLCGFITLCGALTLAQLTSLLPRPGATYHIIKEAFGPFWGFLKAWMEMWVSGPGSVAGLAFVFGEFLSRFFGQPPVLWGSAAILVFMLINLAGIQWGAKTQITLTTIKALALFALVAGSLFQASPVSAAANSPEPGILDLFQFVGLGVAAVLFTYDGWTDVTHIAGEVKEPLTNISRGMAIGVLFVAVLYLLVNFAFLRVVPLTEMREQPSMVATTVATRTFGSNGGELVNALITISILGSLGGLIMTLPRLYFAAASTYEEKSAIFRLLSGVSKKSGAPVGSIIFCASVSILALLFFQSFSRLVNFLVVPMQFSIILAVAAIFPLRKRLGASVPGFPFLPLIYIVVISVFLISALIYHPLDTLIGVGLTATGIPFYLRLAKKEVV